MKLLLLLFLFVLICLIRVSSFTATTTQQFYINNAAVGTVEYISLTTGGGMISLPIKIISTSMTINITALTASIVTYTVTDNKTNAITTYNYTYV